MVLEIMSMCLLVGPRRALVFASRRRNRQGGAELRGRGKFLFGVATRVARACADRRAAQGTKPGGAGPDGAFSGGSVGGGGVVVVVVVVGAGVVTGGGGGVVGAVVVVGVGCGFGATGGLARWRADGERRTLRCGAAGRC
jgi:hypothetical protein